MRPRRAWARRASRGTATPRLEERAVRSHVRAPLRLRLRYWRERRELGDAERDLADAVDEQVARAVLYGGEPRAVDVLRPPEGP